MWVSYNLGGISQFDPETGIFRHISLKGRDTLPDQILRMLPDKHGNIWMIRFGHGIVCYRPSDGNVRSYSFTREDFRKVWLLENVVSDFQFDKKGFLWLATNRGLIRFDPRSGDFRLFLDKRVGNPGFEKNYNVYTSIWFDGDGRIWLGSWGRGLVRYDPVKNRFAAFSYHPDTLTGTRNIVNGVRPGPHGLLFISTLDAGLMALDTVSGRFVTGGDGMSGKVFSGSGTGLFRDREGILWYPDNHGLSKIDPAENRFPYYRLFPPGSSRWVGPVITAPDSGCWAGYSGSDILFVSKEGRIRKYSTNADTGFFGVDQFLYSQDGRLLAATTGGLLIFDPGADRFVPASNVAGFGRSLLDKRVGNMAFDGAGNLWMVSFGGGILCWMKKSNAVLHFTTNSGRRKIFTDFWYSAFTDSRGNVWLGSSQGGFMVYDWTKNYFLVWRHSTADARSFPNAGVLGFEEDSSGRIFIATHLGLLVVSRDSPGSEGFRLIRKQEGLPSNGITGILKDRTGKIWLQQRSGLVVIDPQTFSMRSITSAQGLPDDAGAFAFTAGKHGELFLAAENGYFRLDEERVPALKNPDVYIKSYQIFDQEPRTPGKPVEVDHSRNMLTVHFQAITFSVADSVYYGYYLDGYDSKWKYTRNNSVTYTNLDGGRYKLIVSAFKKGANGPASRATLNFEVFPPFWKTIPFQITSAFFLLALVCSFYKYRIRRVKIEEQKKSEVSRKIAELEMLALRAQMNPHFIFNCLNSINRLVISGDREAVLDYISRFARLIRLILENSRQKTVTLKKEIDLLGLYLEMEKLRFKDKFIYELLVAPDVFPDATEVPAMVIQPYVENAIWHGLMNKEGGGRLVIHFARKDSGVLCTIEDDGIGRREAGLIRSRAAAPHKSFGMDVTGERLRAYNRTGGNEVQVMVEDLIHGTDAKGTRVSITFGDKKLTSEKV